MAEAEKSSTMHRIPPGWVRIWTGAGLLAVAGLLTIAGIEAGGYEADGAATLLFLTALAGFFGLVHLIIGCVMQGMALHEETKTPAGQT